MQMNIIMIMSKDAVRLMIAGVSGDIYDAIQTLFSYDSQLDICVEAIGDYLVVTGSTRLVFPSVKYTFNSINLCGVVSKHNGTR